MSRDRQWARTSRHPRSRDGSLDRPGAAGRAEPVIALRAVQTVDFMTAHWAQLPYELLDVCSRRIVNEVKGVSRVERNR